MKENRQFWVKEIVITLVNVHPLILLCMGWMHAAESFLVLLLSYLLKAVFLQVRMAAVMWIDLVRIRYQKVPIPSLGSKIGTGIGYFIGFTILLLFWLFLYLLFFGNLYNAVDRLGGYESSTLWSGESGNFLKQTMVINAVLFFVIEMVQLWREFRNYDMTFHHLNRALSLNVPLQSMDKWHAFPIFWFLLFYGVFIVLSAGFAFHLAIALFFVFDFGFVFLKKLAERKSPMKQLPMY